MSDLLDELVAGARERVGAARDRLGADELRGRAERRPAPPDLAAALQGDGVAVIAEIKRASPSAGDLAPALDAATQAAAYRDGGAAAVSVLTEPARFRGGLDDLRAAAGVGVPALRKDFVVDRYQVWEARDAGAAAVLLIVAALDDDALPRLAATARRAGLTALVEVHDEDELQRALAVDAAVIGVNARDLRTFEVDRDVFARLRPHVPDDVLLVAESGVRGPGDVRRAGADGADAVLVGEALVTADDPTAAVAALVEAGGPRAAPDHLPS